MSESAGPVVRFEGVFVSRDGSSALENISFRVEAGQFLGVIGPNGAGKTTLLKAMLGLVPVTKGRIEVFGCPPGRTRPADARVGYVPQRLAVPTAFPANVADVVMMGRLSGSGGMRRPRREDWDAVSLSLRRVGLDRFEKRSVGRLSGGEQRRVILAQALCASTRLLILDEPTIGLDLPAEQEFYSLLRQLQSSLALTVLSVSHDLVALAGEADRLICINRQMHVHGNPEEVIHSHAIREAYSCEFDFLAGEMALHEHGAPPQPEEGAGPGGRADD